MPLQIVQPYRAVFARRLSHVAASISDRKTRFRCNSEGSRAAALQNISLNNSNMQNGTARESNSASFGYFFYADMAWTHSKQPHC